MQNRRQIGTEEEALAAEFLESRGYRIVERNFRCRLGEIDLIARDGSVLVFIEVKYRKTGAYGDPAEAVNYRKQQKICKTADYYRMLRRIPDNQSCRFDVVAIQGREIRVIRDAFSYCFY